MGEEPSNVVVLQVLPSLVTGGVERGTIEITRGDRRRRVGPRWWRAPAGGWWPRWNAPAAATSTLPLVSRNPLTIWRNAARLAAVIRAERVAIVHARSRAPAWSAWLACRRTGAHFVTTYHGTYGEDLPFKRRYNCGDGERRTGDRGEPLHRRSDRGAQHGTDPARIRIDSARRGPGGVRSGRGLGRPGGAAGSGVAAAGRRLGRAAAGPA